MNFLKSFERPSTLETVRRNQTPKTEKVTEQNQGFVVPLKTEDTKPEVRMTQTELPEVAVPDETENWFDAYAEILDYLGSDDPTCKLAAVGKISDRVPGYAKTWMQAIPTQTVKNILDQATQEACELGQKCTELMQTGKRDLDQTVNLKNKIGKHSDILRFSENADVESGYKKANDYLRGAAMMVGLS